MLNKKFNGLRIIFLGFLAALVLAFVMCGVTIRDYIARFTNPEQKTGNTAGGRNPVGPSRRYPTQPQPPSRIIPPPPLGGHEPPTEPAASAEAPGTGLFHWGADDGTYGRMKPYIGKWHGATITDTGVTDLIFEMRENLDAKGQFSGFATFAGIPFKPFGNAKPGANLLATVMKRVPHSAILSGTPANGQVLFRLDTAIASQECSPESITIRPFGNIQLFAQWRNKGCPGGEMVMKLEGR
jgi:hypothetical protein